MVYPRFALALLAAASAVEAEVSPSIEADGGDVIVTVPSGMGLKVRQLRDDGTEATPPVLVVTEEQLDSYKSVVREQMAQLEQRVAQGRKESEELLRTYAATQAGKVSAESIQALEGVTATVNEQQKCLDTAGTCGSAGAACKETEVLAQAEAANAELHGHGAFAGALRVVTCADGFVPMPNAPSVVTCTGGSWAPKIEACIEPTTTVAPTTTAADVEKVTCTACIDNFIYAWYVDGKRVAPNLKLQYRDGCGSQIVFQSSAKVVGIFGADGEVGCQAGSFSMQCTTESGSGPWQIDTYADDDRVTSFGAATKAGIKGADWAKPDCGQPCEDFRRMSGKGSGHDLTSVKSIGRAYSGDKLCDERGKYWWIRVDPRL